ncbi:MAG: hypothetical protein CVV27_08265 [Candidatus Melainabacteria bacterium HGW-Melainabacteria-1]|nr:MAG: hypothetical protein CVV27_08265 [Candidatus Melainabacteria bacterium HGW-Melainabacteria-1]
MQPQSQAPNTFSRQNALPAGVSTAKAGFPIAMAERNKLDPQAQLYEVDVWQEASGKSLQYGFLRSDQSGNTLRVNIDVASQQVSVETGFKGTAAPVNVAYWKLDSAQIYALAQSNGLRDSLYLATLWEDTWHISGLKQDLYFQMDAQSGKIKLRCTGPYNNNCVLEDGTPVQRASDTGMQRHIAKRSSR